MVFVSPSTLLRVALKNRVVLPGESVRPGPVMPAMAQVPWEKNRIWIWDASHFTRAKRVAYAIVDVVTRYWIGYLLTTEQNTTQVQLLFARALEDQVLLGPDKLPPDHGPEDPPILEAWSDNRSERSSIDTRQFMALMAIAQHHGRPGSPTDQAHVESFFSHLKGVRSHLDEIRDPAALDSELARIRGEYNTVRLHVSIGYFNLDASTTAAASRYASLAPPACAAPASSGSSRIKPTSDEYHAEHRSRRASSGEEGRF